MKRDHAELDDSDSQARLETGLQGGTWVVEAGLGHGVVLGTELEDDGIADSGSNVCWGVGELSVSTHENAVFLRGDGMSRRRCSIHCVMVGNRSGSIMGPRCKSVCGCGWSNSSSSVASNG